MSYEEQRRGRAEIPVAMCPEGRDDVTIQTKLSLLCSLAEHCNLVVDRLNDTPRVNDIPGEKSTMDTSGVRASLQMALDRFGALAGKLEALAGEIGRL